MKNIFISAITILTASVSLAGQSCFVSENKQMIAKLDNINVSKDSKPQVKDGSGKLGNYKFVVETIQGENDSSKSIVATVHINEIESLEAVGVAVGGAKFLNSQAIYSKDSNTVVVFCTSVDSN